MSASSPKASEVVRNLLAVIGAGAALVGWIAVVGAAREYERFKAAGIPSPDQTASLFPREALIGEGLTAIAGTLILGLFLSAVVYVFVRALATRLIASASAPAGDAAESIARKEEEVRADLDRTTDPDQQRYLREILRDIEKAKKRVTEGGTRFTSVVAAAIATTAVLFAGLFLAIRVGALLAFIVAVVAAVLVAGVFLLRWLHSPLAAAVMTFLAVVVIGGVAGYLRRRTIQLQCSTRFWLRDVAAEAQLAGSTSHDPGETST